MKPWWWQGLAVSQVDGTEQAGCEWAARASPWLREVGEKAGVVLEGIRELQSHMSGSLHHLIPRYFSSVLACR